MKQLLAVIAVAAAATLACTTGESEVGSSVTATEPGAGTQEAGEAAVQNDEGRFAGEVQGLLWQWEGLTTPVEQIVVEDPSLYTIRFQPEGQVEMRADCNRAFGEYKVSEEHKLEFGLFGVTRAMCPPESHSDRYLKDLAQATTFFLQDGKLYLELPYDSGTLKFSRLAEESAAQ